MDVPELLEAASLVVPEEIATENDLTVSDVWEYLTRDDWEGAFGLLEDLGGARHLPLGFWESMADAAEQLGMQRSAAWCRWRCHESRYGVIRADLTLRPASETRRRTPLPGAGTLRPMWDIGHRTPAGEPDLAIAALWVEFTPFLEPGGRATARLAPLTPSRWRHLRPGQAITLHESRPPAGTAVVLEVQDPAEPGALHPPAPPRHADGRG
ncbi:hypothetical protein ABT112_24855 [Streptomyces sp. NPDC002055]|uniref:hypothetical protein n=1 Tax=Streptomyces sp. NPDC002055 TaxID=3154534 RepID=UPI003333C32E